MDVGYCCHFSTLAVEFNLNVWINPMRSECGSLTTKDDLSIALGTTLSMQLL